MKLTTKLWIGLGVCILLSPLGLVLPDHFKAGSAWGEWGIGRDSEDGWLCSPGLARLGELWKAPMPDYAFKGWEERGLTHLSFAYIVSAILGVALIAVATWAIGKCLAKKGE